MITLYKFGDDWIFWKHSEGTGSILLGQHSLLYKEKDPEKVDKKVCLATIHLEIRGQQQSSQWPNYFKEYPTFYKGEKDY